ncbi:MAG: hypothetical protein ACK4PR_06270, partial [Gammaproteobacteria bacterium]
MDYFNHSQDLQIALQCIKTLLPGIQWVEAMPNQKQARQQALSRAQQYTARSKLLLLASSTIQKKISPYQNIEIVPTGNTDFLCQAIATSIDRIAAIIVSHDKITPYYWRKVRELASAEGALMIWDITNHLIDTDNFAIK